MNKFYPPIQISYITEEVNKTLVKVRFFECSLDELKFASKESRNVKGKVKEQKVFELPVMGAEEAREAIYSKLVKEKVVKKVKVPEKNETI